MQSSYVRNHAVATMAIAFVARMLLAVSAFADTVKVEGGLLQSSVKDGRTIYRGMQSQTCRHPWRTACTPTSGRE